VYLGEFVALLGKPSDIVPRGLPLLLSSALQIPAITGLYVRALEITGKDLLEILSMNRLSSWASDRTKL
jgi:hypothetical protein